MDEIIVEFSNTNSVTKSVTESQTDFSDKVSGLFNDERLGELRKHHGQFLD